ncbi:MAG: hypothetical protein F6K50_21150 [Moorea sp. SIO3I7]|nr:MULTISPECIES: hypothetical protein [unclassified Moorena]NEN97932.1 hypothetical protein [Moorena sp. SIO3I7]NEP22510.1 hypothetical protein [Moorena sp. SIO3I6]NEQ58761.1 hypothetical protein [Moorena sp. SIO4A1]
MANLILNAENAPLRSWGGSAVLGVPPMSNCRGSPRRRNLITLSLYGW